MSAGDPYNFNYKYTIEQDIKNSMVTSMASYLNSQMNPMTTASSSIYVTPTTSPSSISITGPNQTGGVLATTHTGNLSWNGNPLAYANYTGKPKITSISDLLGDGMSREIILCKTREECQQKYGEYGLKMFDSMLNELFQEALNSENAFVENLSKEKEKVQKLQDYIMSIVSEEHKQAVAITLYKLLS